MNHLGNICDINGYEVPIVDCIIGGSPCQDLSIAGNRAGLAGKRSGLFMEQIRIVKEMRENDRRLHCGRSDIDVRPRYMVWENVPGAFSSNKGEDFRCVLEEVARVCEESVTIPRPEKGKWSQSGVIIGDSYSIAWRVFDAQYWGVPQRRKRICLVADFNGHSAAEIVFNEAKQHGCTERCSSKSSVRNTGEESRSEIQSFSESLSWNPESSREKREEASTYAEGSFGTSDPVVYDARGNGDENIANTMTCDHQNRITDYTSVVVSIDRETFNTGQSFAKSLGIHEDGVQPTFVARGPGAVAYMDTSHADDVVRLDDKVAPIQARDYKGGKYVVHQVATYWDGTQTAGTLTSKNADGSQIMPDKDNFNCVIEKGVRYIVRRLTPLECERLQGLPDNWTNIGEWVDSNGKRHKLADSHRYKAIGNGIALPSWRWVLKRLCANYERPATMASLFDGLGSFPLIWEQLNGKGTCLWASEIEEFPIAVTKERLV